MIVVLTVFVVRLIVGFGFGVACLSLIVLFVFRIELLCECCVVVWLALFVSFLLLVFCFVCLVVGGLV